MHSLHLAQCTLAEISSQSVQQLWFSSISSNTSERVGSVHSLHLLKALLVEPFLQSVQKLCSVFSLTLFSLNSNIEFSCALLAPAQCPPGRALQSIQQLCLMCLLCTVSPPRCSVTLRLLLSLKLSWCAHLACSPLNSN
jgi:hypothetical protein